MYPSSSHFCSVPMGYETPSSGLKDQRCEPRLSTLLPSYLPVGAVTVRLVPTIVVRWYVASCAALRAGPPFSKTASSRLESPIPLVEPEALLAATEPSSEAKGTFAVTHAIWPNMLKLCV